MPLQTYNHREVRVERFYFTGTETLTAGQPLCFQESPATASSTKGFGFDVEIPNTANRLVFAGIVAPSSVGKQGPGYIDVIVPRPGDILQVKVSRGADVALGTLLKLNEDIDSTATSTAAFDLHTMDTTAASVAGSIIANLLQELPGLAQNLESVASTSTVGATNLTYVKFIG